MNRSRIYSFFIAVSLAIVSPAAALAGCPEPAMSTYVSTPIFITQSVKPNVMIVLDNSGSMNYAAYGTWGGDYGGTITDSLYTGTSPYCGKVWSRVIQSKDDAEEYKVNQDMYFNTDLDIGGFDAASNDTWVGLRFQNLDIPQGATVTRAYIEFTAAAASAANNFSFTIRGQLDDDTVQFSTTDGNISSRSGTSSAVVWTGTTAWVSGVTYQTPDLSAIVQEVVTREGWHSKNSMVFKIDGTGKRDAKPYDASASQAPLLYVEFTPATCTRYYGYFHPDSQYHWDGNNFEISATGQWNGNFLNWLTMRRIDVARKVIMGGLATSRTGGGNQMLLGDNHNVQPSRYWKRWFDSSASSGVSLTPYNGNYLYGIKDGRLFVDTDRDGDPFENADEDFEIKVKKTSDVEPEAFDADGNLAGVLQKVGADQARWGLSFYNDEEGGNVYINIGDNNLTNMITAIQNKKGGTWTPLAETLYEIMRYFQQVSPYYSNSDYGTNLNSDPYYWGNTVGHVACGKSFVLYLTDGESTKDQNIPVSLRNYAAGYKTSPSPTFPDGGSDYMPDVALYARTNDLRSSLAGDQNLILYVVYAFGKGSDLLQDAAKNGGFEDRNGNDRPDQTAEYDEDNDGFPDTYYESEDGYQLEEKLIKAINDILERAASGTAVSVLATSGEGEGNLVQAYFRPTVKSGVTDVNWTGYLQSLWVDSYGNLREDTNGNLSLDVTADKIVEYTVGSTGDARIKRYTVSGTSPYPAYTSANLDAELVLEDIVPLFEAGARLQARLADDRKIFTYIDKDKDGIVDEPTSDIDMFDDEGEAVQFHYSTTAVANVKPYLGVRDYTTWKYLGDQHNDRARNLVMYIRGMEPGYSSASFTGTTTMQVRTRVIDDNVWKLGDIIHSTPVTVSKPPDNYHIIYADESYQRYWSAFKNRETVVYVGANDGMLHAFTSWQYNGVSRMYTKPSGAPSAEQIGDELWAYIPQALLPHLKWIPHKDYGHVYYVDLRPKIFDAKILADDTHYADANDEADGNYDNWGTFLLGGLNFGGKQICSEDTFTDSSGATAYETRNFNPVYFLMDITNPRSPRLVWEREFVGLNMSQSIPAVIKVDNKWLAVFGSGPTGFDGSSTTKGRVYVVDLKTGDSYHNTSSFSSGVTNAWLFETTESNAFINSPVSFDKDLDFNVDAVYLGTSYLDGTTWKGKAYKIAVQIDWNTLDAQTGKPVLFADSEDPNGDYPWKFVSLFNATRPITAPMSLSIDHDEKVWVYFGSGRYLSDTDKTNADTQYIYGIKDPFFDSYYDGANGGYYHDYNISKELALTDLFNATNYVIETDGKVYNGASLAYNQWEDFVDWVGDNHRGWYRVLDTSRERALTKFSVLGGIVFAPTFVPNSDICGYGGDSYLYGMYYETGTAYYEPVFTPGVDDDDEVLVKVSLGAGKASAAGIHVGQESGAKAFIQQSTGIITQQQLNPAFNIKSGLINWRQK
jgi:type IV pilus assembly protein PilY1